MYACLAQDSREFALAAEIPQQFAEYRLRVDNHLRQALPYSEGRLQRLHQAMHYAVLNGGKRVRPLLVYATGECLQIDVHRLDPLAVAIELIHAFSLVHDDLPAMDDDDLRRGRPTVHREFDEATAILAADALQPLAFQTIADADSIDDGQKVRVSALLAKACGALGMTGGQAIDLASEGQTLDAESLRELHALKTGALLSSAVIMTCELVDDIDDAAKTGLAVYADSVGLAFQIRDDILDVEGETDVIGKAAGADVRLGKATWPSVFGLEHAKRDCEALLQRGIAAIECFGADADALRQLARYIADRPA